MECSITQMSNNRQSVAAENPPRRGVRRLSQGFEGTDIACGNPTSKPNKLPLAPCSKKKERFACLSKLRQTNRPFFFAESEGFEPPRHGMRYRGDKWICTIRTNSCFIDSYLQYVKFSIRAILAAKCPIYARFSIRYYIYAHT